MEGPASPWRRPDEPLASSTPCRPEVSGSVAITALGPSVPRWQTPRVRPDSATSGGLQFEAKSGPLGWSHGDALGAASDLILLLEPLVDLLRAAGPRQEHLAPRRVLVGEDEMRR